MNKNTHDTDCQILLVDDDVSFREVAAFHLREEGFKVKTAESAVQGLELLKHNCYPVVVTDVKMPKMDGMAFLKEIHSKYPGIQVVMITAFGELSLAVEAMKAGAFDFIAKPFDRDHFKLTVRRAYEHATLQAEVKELKEQLESASPKMVYKSESMKRIMALANKMADTEATVLIYGESGTGKELVARWLHDHSQRNKAPFVVVNCAALSAELLESELFGHVKGSFTGAVKDRKGKFAQAEGGTIFLDEVGELPLEMQTRLLRVLQEKTIDRVGSDETQLVDVRVIAATNKILEDEVRKGAFREDLFFRLNVFPLNLPPLRERKEDIVPLIDFFSRKYAEFPPKFDGALIQKLEEYDWPGNIRELENMVQRLVLLAEDGFVSEELLQYFPMYQVVRVTESLDITLPSKSFSLEKLEQTIIEKALAMHHNNKAQTARYLKIPRHVLLYRLEKYEQLKRSDKQR